MSRADEPEKPTALPDPEADRGLARIRRELRENGPPPTLLAAIVAWAITLAPAAISRSSPRSALLFAVAAVLAGVTGPLLLPVHPRLGRHVGISLFLGLATLTWLLTSPTLQPARLDPMRASIGAVAWGVFALSWNERWKSKMLPEIDAQAPALQARSTLPRLAVPIAGIGILAGLGYLSIAWRVREVDRALFAHALALGCAVAVITSAATVAVARGRASSSSSSRRLTAQALRPLILLVALAVGGAVLIVLRDQ
ncbi:MAG TPA: hypothetical protein VK459_18100 [Polyangiaceae bacterium]|nr:hypothetical protein [Polyangiaceae bacterium]